MKLEQILIPAGAGILGALIGGLLPIWAASRAHSKQTRREDLVLRRDAYLQYIDQAWILSVAFRRHLVGEASIKQLSDLIDTMNKALWLIQMLAPDSVTKPIRVFDQLIDRMKDFIEAAEQKGKPSVVEFEAKFEAEFEQQYAALNQAMRLDLLNVSKS